MNKLRIMWCVLALAAQASCASDLGSSNRAAGPMGADGDDTSAAESSPAANSEAREAAPTPTTVAAPTASAAPSSPPASGTGTSGMVGSGPAASTPAGTSIAPIVPGAPPPPASPAPDSASGATPPSSSAAKPVTTSPTGGTVQSGTLTAGAWDDNLNFDRFKKYREGLQQKQLPGIISSTLEEHNAAHEKFSQRGVFDTLDVSLIIDTTGSMGDEIRYLQAEFLALSNAIEAKYPNAKQRWSLVAYRDKGDDYVTRTFDFAESAEDFRSKLSMLYAGGGGDFPEAPDAALEATAQLTWRTDEKTARLAFWVADAPHHNDRAGAMLEAIRTTRDMGVHLYPVASSGVDELTELTMRSAAQLTGGRYVFLTDDSGAGGAHKEPTIPCYFVTRLDQAILRMVDAELTGMHSAPKQDEIIRTTGKPADGRCELSSGETVEVF